MNQWMEDPVARLCKCKLIPPQGVLVGQYNAPRSCRSFLIPGSNTHKAPPPQGCCYQSIPGLKQLKNPKAEAVLALEFDQNSAFPVVIICFLFRAFTRLLLIGGPGTYRFIRWGSCWYLRWMNIGKGLISPHRQSIEIRL